MASAAAGTTTLPRPLARWLAAINSQDVAALTELMTPNHQFFVEGEAPTTGVEANCRAWQRYFERFPNYTIHVDEAFARTDAWYLVGHTTGSHVPRELEVVSSSVIWRAALQADQLVEWSIYPATNDHRRRFDITLLDLPGQVALYKRTPMFTGSTIPAGLQRAHSTKRGTWGRIVITRGELAYRILEPAFEEHRLSPARPGIVQPTVRHEVAALGDVEFHVEFYR